MFLCLLHDRVELPPYPGFAPGCRHTTDEQQLFWCEACAKLQNVCQICGEDVHTVMAVFAAKNGAKEEAS